MLRFIVGVAVGAVTMYWFLTGQIPFRDEIESWLARAAVSYSAEHHRRAANELIGRN
ncbi:MAG TPA: hypothetical protein VIS07_09150 [Candidatus Binatia bacterium]